MTTTASRRSSVASNASSTEAYDFGTIVVLKRGDGKDGATFDVDDLYVTFGEDSDNDVRIRRPNVEDFQAIISVHPDIRMVRISNIGKRSSIKVSGAILRPESEVNLPHRTLFEIGDRRFRYDMCEEWTVGHDDKRRRTNGTPGGKKPRDRRKSMAVATSIRNNGQLELKLTPRKARHTAALQRRKSLSNSVLANVSIDKYPGQPREDGTKPKDANRIGQSEDCDKENVRNDHSGAVPKSAEKNWSKAMDVGRDRASTVPGGMPPVEASKSPASDSKRVLRHKPGDQSGPESACPVPVPASDTAADASLEDDASPAEDTSVTDSESRPGIGVRELDADTAAADARSEQGPPDGTVSPLSSDADHADGRASPSAHVSITDSDHQGHAADGAVSSGRQEADKCDFQDERVQTPVPDPRGDSPGPNEASLRSAGHVDESCAMEGVEYANANGETPSQPELSTGREQGSETWEDDAAIPEELLPCSEKLVLSSDALRLSQCALTPTGATPMAFQVSKELSVDAVTTPRDFRLSKEMPVDAVVTPRDFRVTKELPVNVAKTPNAYRISKELPINAVRTPRDLRIAKEQPVNAATTPRAYRISEELPVNAAQTPHDSSGSEDLAVDAKDTPNGSRTSEERPVNARSDMRRGLRMSEELPVNATTTPRGFRMSKELPVNAVATPHGSRGSDGRMVDSANAPGGSRWSAELPVNATTTPRGFRMSKELPVNAVATPHGSRGSEGRTVDSANGPGGSRMSDELPVNATTTPRGFRMSKELPINAVATPHGSRGPEGRTVDSANVPGGSRLSEELPVNAVATPHGSRGSEGWTVDSANGPGGSRLSEELPVNATTTPRGFRMSKELPVNAVATPHGSHGSEGRTVDSENTPGGSRMPEELPVNATTTPRGFRMSKELPINAVLTPVGPGVRRKAAKEAEATDEAAGGTPAGLETDASAGNGVDTEGTKHGDISGGDGAKGANVGSGTDDEQDDTAASAEPAAGEGYSATSEDDGDGTQGAPDTRTPTTKEGSELRRSTRLSAMRPQSSKGSIQGTPLSSAAVHGQIDEGVLVRDQTRLCSTIEKRVTRSASRTAGAPSNNDATDSKRARSAPRGSAPATRKAAQHHSEEEEPPLEPMKLCETFASLDMWEGDNAGDDADDEANGSQTRRRARHSSGHNGAAPIQPVPSAAADDAAIIVAKEGEGTQESSCGSGVDSSQDKQLETTSLMAAAAAEEQFETKSCLKTPQSVRRSQLRKSVFFADAIGGGIELHGGSHYSPARPLRSARCDRKSPSRLPPCTVTSFGGITPSEERDTLNDPTGDENITTENVRGDCAAEPSEATRALDWEYHEAPRPSPFVPSDPARIEAGDNVAARADSDLAGDSDELAVPPMDRRAQLWMMTVVQLRKILTSRNTSTKGRKAELIDRILQEEEQSVGCRAVAC